MVNIKRSNSDAAWQQAATNHLSFNQDCTCIALADRRGIRIWSLEAHKLCYQSDLGAIRLAEMLFCTSLMAYVGAGEQPALTPRKLTLLNTTTQSVIQDISLPTSVLAVRLNRKRMVVVLEKRTIVYALETLELLCTLDTQSNPKGCCALTVCAEPCLLALPSSAATGALRIYNAAAPGGNVLCELAAHRTPVAVMAWRADGSLLASASAKGTVIRVHRLPQAARAFSFRRGTYTAPINALAFSPPDAQLQLLAAASGHGKVHLFRLEEHGRHSAVVAASGLLAAVMPPSITDVVEPPRSALAIELPGRGIPAVCSLQPAPSRATEGAAGHADSQVPGNEGELRQALNGAAMLVVATAEGLLYEYRVAALKSSAQQLTHSLEGEWFLLAGSSQALPAS